MRRTHATLGTGLLVLVLCAGECGTDPDLLEDPGAIFVSITEPGMNTMVTAEPLRVRGFAQSDLMVTQVVYQLNGGPEMSAGGGLGPNNEDFLIQATSLVEGLNTIRVTGRNSEGREAYDEIEVLYRPGIEAPAFAFDLQPDTMTVETTEFTTRNLGVRLWRTPDSQQNLGISLFSLPSGIEWDVTLVIKPDNVIRGWRLELRFPPGIIPGVYDLGVQVGTSFIFVNQSLQLTVTGLAPLGCEDFDLRLDFDPQIPSPGSDVVPVFVDRAPGFSGPVELGLDFADGVDAYSFAPNPVAAGETFSMLNLTLVEEIAAGTILEMAVVGGSPNLETAASLCRLPMLVTVIDPAG